MDTGPSQLDQPLSRAGSVTYRSLRVTVGGFFKVWNRLSVEGSQHVPATGPFILALGAHRSILDTPLAAMTSKRVLRYMGAEAYFEIPVFGQFLDMVGGFPVERGMTDRQALRLSEDLLKAGHPLVLFPESTRGSGPSLAEIREGTAFIASRAQVPIVPVGIGGAERSLGIGRRVPRPSRLALVVGEPLFPPVSIDGERIKRSQVNALSSELSNTLQRLFDQAQQIAS